MPNSCPQFSPKQIAEAMSVSESSVKRWCDQDLIETVRTVGGHRRVTLQGLHRFLEKSGRQLAAPDILGLANIDTGKENSVIANSPLKTGTRSASSSTSDSSRGSVHENRTDQIDQFGLWLIDGDRNECFDRIERLVREGYPRWYAVQSLMTNAMQSIGAAWQANRIEVYEEHVAVNNAMEILVELKHQIEPPAVDAPIAIGGSPTGDPYQLPTALVQLSLAETGWNAINLGVNLPWQSIAEATRRYQPRFLWLSISFIKDLETFIPEQNEFYSSIKTKTSLLVGGQALDEVVRPKLSFTAYCDDLIQMHRLTDLLRS